MRSARNASFDISVIVLVATILLSGCAAPLEIKRMGDTQTTTRSENVPINNCSGLAPATMHRSLSNVVYHEVQVQDSQSAGLGLSLNLLTVGAEIARSYGYKQGQADSQTQEVELVAPPGTNVIYTIEWVEVWASGGLYDPVTGKTWGSYRIRRDGFVRIIKAQEERCA